MCPLPARRHKKNVLESKHRVLRDIFVRLMDERNDANFVPIVIQQTFRFANDLYGNDFM